MPQFNVCVGRRVYSNMEIEINAVDQEEAENMALRILAGTDDLRVVDETDFVVDCDEVLA